MSKLKNAVYSSNHHLSFPWVRKCAIHRRN